MAARIRWGLLSAAAVISVLCVVTGVPTNWAPVTPQGIGCSPAFECMDPSPIYWIVAGLIGCGCCVALIVVTIMVEIIIRLGRGASA